MKQALFLTEKKIDELESDLLKLKREGVFIDDDIKNLFGTQAEYRALFHTVDVNLVKGRTDDFVKRLAAVESKIADTFKELRFRKNFSAFLLLLFAGMGVTLYLITKTSKE